MIIETTDNRYFQVRETDCPELAHVWFGIPVKRAKGVFIPRVKARETLVRKEGSRIVVAAVRQ